MIAFSSFLQRLAIDAREGERGQTMAEYAVVLSVIVLGVVAALALLVGGIGGTLDSVTSAL